MATQDAPIQDGSDDADDQARLDGLLAQVRSDIELGIAADSAVLLRQRLDDAGVAVTDEEFTDLLERVRN